MDSIPAAFLVGVASSAGGLKEIIENNDRITQIADNHLQNEPIESAKKERVYSKNIPATEKLKKQLSFAKLEQTSEEAKGFKWDSPVETAFRIEVDDTQELTIGMASTQGRRNEMEDTHLATKISFSMNSKPYEGELYGVFDGHSGTEVADLLVARFKDVLEEELNGSEGESPTDETITEALTNTFLRIQKEAHAGLNKAGSTATCAFIFNGKIYVPNVGDARTIIVKKGETVQLSEDAKPLKKRFQKQINAVQDDDHSINRYILEKNNSSSKILHQDKDVSRIESTRKLNDNEFEVGRIFSKKRFGCSLAMARTVGDRAFELSAKPKITGVDSEEGDLLVLACDGLWDVATTNEVGEAVKAMLAMELDETQIASELTKAALVHGSKDNISVMVVKK